MFIYKTCRAGWQVHSQQSDSGAGEGVFHTMQFTFQFVPEHVIRDRRSYKWLDSPEIFSRHAAQISRAQFYPVRAIVINTLKSRD
jgi:hypothetical protein